MSNVLKEMNFTFAIRNAPLRGAFTSDMWNDTTNEISVDLINLSNEWNNNLVPLCAGLPTGSLDTAVNPYVNGLDGANIWTDQDAATGDTTYYNSTKSRPNTIKENITNLYTYINNEINDLKTETEALSTTIATKEDITISDYNYGLVLYSPNGNRWRIQINNAGTLTATSF